MALTETEIASIVNPALSRICAGSISVSAQADVKGVESNRHYEQTRDSLLRSFLWPFAKKRAELPLIYSLTLSAAPTLAVWAAGDVITGADSGTTATILKRISDVEYEIYDLDGEFEDGEDIANDADTPDTAAGAAGYPVVEVATPEFEWTFQYLLPADCMRLWTIHEDDGTDEVDERWEIEGRRILTDYSTCKIKYVQKITDPAEFDTLFTELFILRLAMKLINPLAGTSSERYKAELREELRVAEGKARTVSAQEANTSGRSDFNLARYRG